MVVSLPVLGAQCDGHGGLGTPLVSGPDLVPLPMGSGAMRRAIYNGFSYNRRKSPPIRPSTCGVEGAGLLVTAESLSDTASVVPAVQVFQDLVAPGRVGA